MAGRFTPRDTAFYDLLAEGGRNVAESANVLAGLCDPAADRVQIAARMRDLEHAGDTVTHRILRQLNKSFVTPFDREDIYRLAGTLDDVVDAMDEATDFIVVADVGKLPDLMLQQVRLVQQASIETSEALSRLVTLQDLEPYWIKVNELENEADQVYRQLLSQLFGGSYDTLQVLKLREVADLFEEAADALEHVAHAVETIAVKES
jgi:predicted phosphate transport protein (TIGR00153 family)